MEQLCARQERFQKEIGGFTKFHFDLEECSLTFRKWFAIRTYRVIPVGTYVPEVAEWMWAWANDSFPAKAQEAAGVFRELYEETHYNIYGSVGWKGLSPEGVTELCAVAIGHVDGIGVFKDISETRVLYLAVLPH